MTIASLLINLVAIWVASVILPGVHMDGWLTVALVTIVFAVINTFLKPVLVILSLPLTLITLGLFLIVLNILLVYLVTWLVPGFTVDGWLSTLLFSLIVTLVSSVLSGVSGS